jgi:hypothetical protein
MTTQSALRTVALAMLLLASMVAWTPAQEKTDGPAEGADKKEKAIRPDRAAPPADDTNDNPAQGLGAVGKVLPVGEKNLDVKIPSFKDGIPSSTVRANSMMRIDDENMAMERMDIRLYGATHAQDVRIQLVTALYHMPSQILSSDKRSRVSREDFDIQGDSMIFDTRTGQGKMVGNVRMVIFDADSLTPQKNDASGSTSSSDKSPATDKKADAPPDSAPAPAPAPATPTSPPSNEK